MMKRRVVCVRVRAFWGATVVVVLAAVLGAPALVAVAQESAPYSERSRGRFLRGGGCDAGLRRGVCGH